MMVPGSVQSGPENKVMIPACKKYITRISIDTSYIRFGYGVDTGNIRGKPEVSIQYPFC